MFYNDSGTASGLYELEYTVSGSQDISSLTGTIQIKTQLEKNKRSCAKLHTDGGKNEFRLHLSESNNDLFWKECN
ncbi:hypothetical protein SDC9_154562 [bioreactor metagenome]|uniref:Uncharacterized protein n=1 Tax=bioreactor metagenome TaxID=1076179 RepID=A0A645F0U0_9ZZZZ